MRMDTKWAQLDTHFGDFTFHHETQSVNGTDMARCAATRFDLSWGLGILAAKTECAGAVQMRVCTNWYHSAATLAILAGRSKHFRETGPTLPDAPCRDSICQGVSVF